MCSRALAMTTSVASAVAASLSRCCMPEAGNGDHRRESAAQANKASAAQLTGDLTTSPMRPTNPTTGSSAAATMSSATPIGNSTKIAREDNARALGAASARTT